MKMMTLYLLFLGLSLSMACGVKKDPEPPETPAEIGHGQPLFKIDSEDSAPASIKGNRSKDDGDPESTESSDTTDVNSQ